MSEDRGQHINTGGGSIGNVVGSDASVGGDVTSTQTSQPAPEQPSPTPPRRAALGAVTYASLALASVILLVFLALGITGVLDWKYALPAALAGGIVIGAGALISGDLRG